MSHTPDLFGSQPQLASESIAEHAWILRGFAHSIGEQILQHIETIAGQAPFRQQVTPGGFTMSVAMTSCGELGWVTDRSGYRYSPVDPLSDRPWPAMPPSFRDLAISAAAEAGFAGFDPQGCLINRYQTGARMSLHQDKDERALEQPIVSVSLGAPATFLFGGPHRSDPTQRYRLEHGDVVVWGGASRLFFHGVAPLGKRAEHQLTGPIRYNLTFRRVR